VNRPSLLLLAGLAAVLSACAPRARRDGGEIEIIRDRWGIAHVYGPSIEAVFHGAGYATAEDRLFQMSLRRRSVQGRTAEILGRGPDDRFLRADRRARILGFARRAAERLGSLSPENRRALEAYADGVNAYLDEHRRRLPAIFARYGGDPEPWTAADCLAIWDALGDRFSFGWTDELRVKRERERRGETGPAEVRPRIDDTAEIVSEDEFKRANPDAHARLQTRRRDDGRKAAAAPRTSPEVTLSHNWVVSGARSATGKPILESDPHYVVTNPSFWYEIHLAGGGYNARGLGVAGAPAFLIGWNDRCAWGVTALSGDSADLYEEKVDPARPGGCFWKGQWQPFGRREETIRVKGGDEVRLEVRASRHGPIVDDLLEGVRPGEAYALRYTVLESDSASIGSVLDFMRAADWTAFRSALRPYVTPPFHLIYADTAGHISYQTGTLVAARTAERLTPRVGWTGEDEWSMVPFDDLPTMLDPRAGFITTANHLVAGSWYPYLVGAGRGDGPRSLRLREILSADPARKFSVRDFVTDIHQDSINPILRDAVLLARAVVAAERDGDPDIGRALAALEGWDFRLSTQAAAYPVARAMLAAIEGRKLAGTPLEARYGEGWNGVSVMFKELMPRFRATGQPPADPVVRAWLKAALRDGFRSRGYGANEAETTGWMRPGGTRADSGPAPGAAAPSGDTRLGIVRRLAYQDIPEGYGAERFGSLAPELDLTSPPLRSPLTQTIWAQEGGSYSQIVDLADPDRSLSKLPPGISENPSSPHFKDQMDLWASGEFHAAPLSRKAVEAIQESSRRLEYRPGR
jgi:penicillin amidase